MNRISMLRRFSSFTSLVCQPDKHGFDHVQIARSTLAPGHLAILWWVANWCRMLNANEAARVGEPARNTGTP